MEEDKLIPKAVPSDGCGNSGFQNAAKVNIDKKYSFAKTRVAFTKTSKRIRVGSQNIAGINDSDAAVFSLSVTELVGTVTLMSKSKVAGKPRHSTVFQKPDLSGRPLNLGTSIVSFVKKQVINLAEDPRSDISKSLPKLQFGLGLVVRLKNLCQALPRDDTTGQAANASYGKILDQFFIETLDRVCSSAVSLVVPAVQQGQASQSDAAKNGASLGIASRLKLAECTARLARNRQHKMICLELMVACLLENRIHLFNSFRTSPNLVQFLGRLAEIGIKVAESLNSEVVRCSSKTKSKTPRLRDAAKNVPKPSSQKIKAAEKAILRTKLDKMLVNLRDSTLMLSLAIPKYCRLIAMLQSSLYKTKLELEPAKSKLAKKTKL
jgi:hypothetical protein